MSAPLAQRYRPIRALGEGAMGRVLLVEDAVEGREVAMKVVAAKGAAGAAEKTLLQMKQEFHLMTRLRHPNCCAVYDFGVLEDGAPYFTMEVVPGQGLDELLPVPPDRFRGIFAQLLLALGYVHEQGLVHCDLKPANVRVTPVGVVKLMDYGLMELAGQPPVAIKGTPAYMAPEMIRRAPLDRRADLYAAGCLAFELLAGRPPFERPGIGDLLRAHVGEPAPSLRDLAPDVPADLAALVAALLRKEPAERPGSAGAALEALGAEVPAGLGGSLLAPPFVGREAELAALEARVAAIRAGGSGGAVWISGTAGAGKSRLLDEVRCRALLAEAPFVRGAGHERRGVPYGPVTAILRGLLPHLRRHVPDRLAAEAPVLVAVLPELGVAPAPAMDAPRNEALRLQAAITGVLVDLAARQPFVLALEDWRGADAASRDFLAAFLRNAAEAPVLTLLTTRRGAEAGDGPEAAVPMPLAGLAEADVARMLAGMLGTVAVDVAFAARVAAISRGVPQVVEELLDDLVKRGLLARRQGRWNTDADLEAALASTDAGGLWRLRLEALGGHARVVARAAATYGRPVTLELLQAMAGLEDDALFAALDELGRAHVLAPAGDGAYRLVGEELDRALQARTPPADRAAYLATAAAWLETELAGRPLAEAGIEALTALADTGLRAEVGARAWPWALEAARRNLALYGLAEADRLLAAVLAAAGRTGLAPRARYDAVRLLADARRLAGKPAEAAPLLDEAIALAASLGEDADRGRLLTTRAKVEMMRGRYDEATDWIDRAVTVCADRPARADFARALLTAARVAYFRGEPVAAEIRALAAVEAAEAARDPGCLGQASAFLGYLIAVIRPDEIAAGVARLKQAVALLKEAGDRPGLYDAYVQLGEAETQLGNYRNARAAYKESGVVARSCGLEEDEALALVNLAATDAELGAFDEALANARAAAAAARRLGARLPLCSGLAVEALVEARLGRAAEADARIAEAREVVAAMKNAYLAAYVGLLELQALLALDRAPAARALADDLAPRIEATGQAEFQARLGVLRADALARLGERAEAAFVLAGVREAAARVNARGLLVAASLVQARLELGARAWEACRATAGGAIALARAIGATYQADELTAVLAAAGRGAAAGLPTTGPLEPLADPLGRPRLGGSGPF